MQQHGASECQEVADGAEQESSGTKGRGREEAAAEAPCQEGLSGADAQDLAQGQALFDFFFRFVESFVGDRIVEFVFFVVFVDDSGGAHPEEDLETED